MDVEISEQIRQAMKAEGVSQSALSRMSGIPQPRISEALSPGVDSRVSTLVTITKALGREIRLVKPGE